MTEAADRLQCDGLRREGAVRLDALVIESLSEWRAVTQPFFDLGRPGHRVSACPPLSQLARALCNRSAFVSAAGTGWRCVRAIAFNKSRDEAARAANWSLGWHQDRTIAVAAREPAPGFEVWSTKDGIEHVEPPFALLERMVTLRVHLDTVDDENAPLLVAAGSHRLGKVPEDQLDAVVSRSVIRACHAEAGDGWLYATPILHASARSTTARSRRVIHLDFSRDDLPAPLDWAGIG